MEAVKQFLLDFFSYKTFIMLVIFIEMIARSGMVETFVFKKIKPFKKGVGSTVSCG